MKLFKGYQRSKDVENLSKNIFKRKKDIEKTFYSCNLSKKTLKTRNFVLKIELFKKK